MLRKKRTTAMVMKRLSKVRIYEEKANTKKLSEAVVVTGNPNVEDKILDVEVDGRANELKELIQEYDHNRRLFFIGFHILNLFTAVILAEIVYLLAKYLEGFSLQPDRAEQSDYNVHLICTVLGLVIIPAYAMLLYRIFPIVKQSTLTSIHVAMLMITSFFSIFGIKISYESHHVYAVIHLYSLHGWLGVAITTLLFFCIVSGNWIYLSPTQLPFMVSLHKNAGYCMLVFSCCASVSGILTRSQSLLTSSSVVKGEPTLPDRVILLNSLGIFIVMFSILVRALLTSQRFQRRPRPGTTNEEDVLSTGLLRYLATHDASVMLPDEPIRHWTAAVIREPEDVSNDNESGLCIVRTIPFATVISEVALNESNSSILTNIAH